MTVNILVIQGHPDSKEHLGHALATAYLEAARQAGHNVRMLAVADLTFPVLLSRHDWEHGEPAPDILRAQEDIQWATHLVFFYPLWLGDMPALLKAFLEQVARPSFVSFTGGDKAAALKGKSARIVVTMGMPGFVYRGFFMAHSLKSFKRNILRFIGIKPVRTTVFGMVEGAGEQRINRWLVRMQDMGRKAR